MSCYRCPPPVSGRSIMGRTRTDLDDAWYSAVCASCQNIQGREKVVVSEPTWISNSGGLILHIFLTLRGQGSPSRNLVEKQRLEIAGFDPSRRP
jgi:hypothetical protein